jgi:PAS domain S-box-containing protein
LNKHRSSSQSITLPGKERLHSQMPLAEVVLPSIFAHYQSELLDFTHDAIFIRDLEHHILTWNKKAEQLFGWSLPEASGRDAYELLPTVTPYTNEEIDQFVLQRDQWECDIVYNSRSKKSITVASRQRLLRDHDGQPLAIIELDQDITAQRQTEQVLKELMQKVMAAGEVGLWTWNFTNSEKIMMGYGPLGLFGIPAYSTLTEDQFLDIVHPNDREELLHTLRLSIQQHTAYTHEYRVIWPDDSIHWLEVHGRSLYDEEGQATGMVGIAVDITEKKHTEQALKVSEAKLRRITESDIVGVVVADNDGAIVEANSTFLHMLGYTREEFVPGQLNYKQLTPDEYTEQDIEIVRGLQERGYFKLCEKEYYNKAHERVPILITGVMLDKHYHINLIVDITAQRELAKQKETFMSIVGHELRTPLTAINGSIQLAQRRMQKFLHHNEAIAPEVQEFLDKMAKLLEQSLRQTRVQNRLINDLLDISRLAVDRLELALQPDDLSSIVFETVEDLRYAESNHTIELKLPANQSIPVLVDADRIEQVVANYITNALKYSTDEAPVMVEVELEPADQEPERVRVWVRDQGCGLSEEERQHIWDRFYRTSDAKDQKGNGVNLGLGLHICQVLIRRHNGEVGVESTKGQGSSFWFSLPLLKQQHCVEQVKPSTDHIDSCHLE